MLRVNRLPRIHFVQDVLVDIKVTCCLRQRYPSALTILTAASLNSLLNLSLVII